MECYGVFWSGQLGGSRFIKKNNNFAGASRFCVHFFAVTARLRRENAQFRFLVRT